MKNIKHIKLKNLVTIISGYPFRTKIETDPSGNTFIIQMEDINKDHTLNTSSLSKTNLKEVRIKYLLREGDILFTPKGYNNYATLIDKPLTNTVPIAHFYIIKIKNSDTVTPSYLAWYINQKEAQLYFKSYGAGTNIPFVNKKLLEELIIKLPPLILQNKIVKIYNLTLKEQKLLNKIQEKRKLLIDTILLEKIQNS